MTRRTSAKADATNQATLSDDDQRPQRGGAAGRRDTSGAPNAVVLPNDRDDRRLQEGEVDDQTASGSDIDPVYAEMTRLCERLHRRYLDIVRVALSRAGDDAITPVQALMLLDVGDGEVEMRDLVDRGYYLSTTATYNIRKLVECGYLEQTRAQRDRRMSRVRLTGRGRVLRDQLEGLDGERSRAFLSRPEMVDKLATAVDVLRELERSFFDQMSYRRF